MFTAEHIMTVLVPRLAGILAILSLASTGLALPAREPAKGEDDGTLSSAQSDWVRFSGGFYTPNSN